MIKIDLPADYFLELLRNRTPFSLSRFGDGEIIAMFNPSYFRNKQYSNWILTCGKDLKKIFLNNYQYYHCYLDGTFWDKGPHRGSEFINFMEQTCPEMPLYRGEIWQDLSFSGRISELASAISTHKSAFIGGQHLRNLIHLDGMNQMKLIQVHDLNAYDDKGTVFNQILQLSKSGYDLFAFSASIMSKVLIDELYPIIGSFCYLIDFGSVFDPYCGLLSRAGMVYYGFDKFQPYTKMKLK